TSFASLKQIDASLLNIGYAEDGPSTGPAVVLLDGWPYDIHSYVDVAPLLASSGYRVIVPYLRGYGRTRVLSNDTCRNGQQSVVALDIIALMDALKIEKAIIGGFDWGARTADIMAALWPERCKAIVSVSGYLITSIDFNRQPLPPQAELGWWYQYYFSTERGRLGYAKYYNDFNKLIWKNVSRKWRFDMRRTSGQLRPSTTPIMWRSSSITIVGAWAWPKASRATTSSSRRCSKARSNAVLSLLNVMSRSQLSASTDAVR